MIFPKKQLNLTFNHSNFFASNFESLTVVVKGKKYEIRKEQGFIKIERKFNDIFDTMGFVPLRMIVFASGTIKQLENQIVLNLEIKIKEIFRVLIIGVIFFFGSISIFLCTIDILFALFFGSILFGFLGLNLLLFRFGVNEFQFDLERDINYFK